MTLNGHYALCFRIDGFFKAHHENLKDNDQSYLQQNVANGLYFLAIGL